LKYLEYGTPDLPGHEGAGVVVTICKEVKNFRISDHE